MSDEIDGDGTFQGIVLPCQMCLGGGVLLTIHGPPAMLLRADRCPRCAGAGNVRIRCARDEVEAVIRRLPPSRVQLAVRQSLTRVGLCPACYGCGTHASVEYDEEQAPLRYAEAPCPSCGGGTAV